MQAAAQNKADDQQRRTADPKVQAGDGERIHLLGHGFVPRPGQRSGVAESIQSGIAGEMPQTLGLALAAGAFFFLLAVLDPALCKKKYRVGLFYLKRIIGENI